MFAATCTRGPEPPAPREELIPSVVGVIKEAASAPPVALRARVNWVKNWPGEADEAEGLYSETLLLGGQRPDASWSYELAGWNDADGCWFIFGGSFDRGDTVQFSSGLTVPKAPGFEIRGDITGERIDREGFPGHEGDLICLDETERAVFFLLFQPR
jgi:hypothetical protein